MENNSGTKHFGTNVVVIVISCLVGIRTSLQAALCADLKCTDWEKFECQKQINLCSNCWD